MNIKSTIDTRRPFTVRVTTILLGVFSFIGIIIAIRNPMIVWVLWYHYAHFSLMLAAWISLMTFKRAQTTYYLAAVSLSGLVVKALILSFSVRLVNPLLGEPVNRAAACVLAAGLVLLFWRFSFGKPSRRFFGFSQPPIGGTQSTDPQMQNHE